MVYKKQGKKGSKTLGDIVIIDDECRKCIYYSRGSCQGRYESIVPCLFAKNNENDTSENWIQY